MLASQEAPDRGESVKSEDDIARRLQNLVTRHQRLYIQERQDKLPHNCLHNYLHTPTTQLKASKSTNTPLAPRKQVTLIVIQPEMPIRLCTYGSNDPSTWNGDICDSEAQSRPCPYFTAKVSEANAAQEFREILEDDSETHTKYLDVATLQWALNTRAHKSPLCLQPPVPNACVDDIRPVVRSSFFRRFLDWILFRPRTLPGLPPSVQLIQGSAVDDIDEDSGERSSPEQST